MPGKITMDADLLPRRDGLMERISGFRKQFIVTRHLETLVKSKERSG